MMGEQWGRTGNMKYYTAGGVGREDGRAGRRGRLRARP